MTRRGAILAAFAQIWAQTNVGQQTNVGFFTSIEPKEFRVRFTIPIVITDGTTEVRLTPEEIMEALRS